MSLRIVRLGTPRHPDEGLRLGTVRRPPRGVARADFARLDFYDLWFPTLAPSAEVVKQAQGADTPAQWAAFARAYRKEMTKGEAPHALDLLAALSHRTQLAVGCYCADAARCHRSVLAELLAERGADIVA